MILTRDQILGFTKLEMKTLAVPEWGDEATVIVRELTASERDEFESTFKGNMNTLRAKFVSLVVVDEAGNKVFTDADIDKLGKLSGAAIDRIFWFGMELSGMKKSDAEDLVKNSARVS
jgi:hypothetical protein